MQSERAIARWVTLAAALVAVGLALGVPGAWFFFSYERVAGSLEAEAEIAGSLITQIISANPELWEFERMRLEEYLSRRPRRGDAEVRRVVNLKGEVVAESADPLPRPWIRRTAPLLDAGERVGAVEISRSLLPRLRAASLLAILLAIPAMFLFRTLRTVPLTALQRAEGELRRQRDAAQKYLDVAGVAFVILDAAGRVELVNRKGAELLGRPPDDVLGREWGTQFVEPASRDALSAAAAGAQAGEVFAVEFAVLRPSGDRRVVGWYATPLAEDRGARTGLLLSGVDITHQRQLEEQLRHAQKLRAVGQLASGVAHDFNNVLAAIKARAGMLRSDLAVGSPHRIDADEILAAADRASALTRSLLVFSRRQALAAEPIDLCELVRRCERRLRRLLPEEIALVAELPAKPLAVVADPVQLEQVLSHLVSNAKDAIHGTGRVVIGASTTTIDADVARRLGLAAGGAYAQVAVTDTGVGLDAEAQSRLFEPFYTTKDASKGMGLGLSIAFGILELHRGTIRVTSEPGSGTTVALLLPLGATPYLEGEEKLPGAETPEP